MVEEKQQNDKNVELVFVDSSIIDHQSLVKDALNNSGIELSDEHVEQVLLSNQVIELEDKLIVFYAIDHDENGLQKITEIISKYENIDSLHLLSHADDGVLKLGDTTLTNDNLSQFSDTLQSWQRFFNEGADFLIYGCNLAEGIAGIEFVEQLSQLTQLDVAASTDLTGSSDLNGNWVLEHQTGSLETTSLLADNANNQWSGLLVASPVTMLNIPSNDLIDSSFDFEVSFDNAGADVGFAPYFDLILPAAVTGISTGTMFDGAVSINQFLLATWDGTQWLDTQSDPLLIHPYDNPNNPMISLPTLTLDDAGANWIIGELPFGSYSPEQPAGIVSYTGVLDSSAGAIVGIAETGLVRGGFRFGDQTPLNDPDTDPPVVESSFNPGNITPTVIEITKTDNRSESEVVQGPNSPITYTISLDIATNQDISDLTIQDIMDTNIQYIDGSLTIISSPIAMVEGDPTNVGEYSTPDPTGPQNPTLNEFNFNFGDVTGVSGNDIVFSYQAFIPQLDADSNNILNPVSGAADTTTNTVTANANFDPDGPGGPDLPAPTTDSDSEDVTIRSTAVQKSVSVVGGGDVLPGATLEYRLAFQVSDFFAFNQKVFNDVLSDGLLFDSTFTPTYSLFENGVNTSNAPFSMTNFTVTNNAGSGGTSDIQFRLSDQLISDGQDGTITGDLFASDVNQQGLTQGVIIFRAVIQQDFTDLNGGDKVTLGDDLTNDVTIQGTVELEGGGNGSDVSDTSGADVTIEDLAVTKSIYAINDVIGVVDNNVQAGDKVTYRLTVNLPAAAINDLVLSDFLPIPVYDVTELTIFPSGTSGSSTPPPAGTISFGPSHDIPLTLVDDNDVAIPTTAPPYVPTVTVNANGDNSFQVDFGSFSDSALPVPGGYTIDVLYSVTITDKPFADGLLLTNQLLTTYDNSVAPLPPEVGIGDIVINQPSLFLTKGVVSTDNTNASLTEPNPPGVTFDPPNNDINSDGSAFQGTITSSLINTNPITSDLESSDSLDLVKFAIVIENQGGADGFDVTITDTLTAGYGIPTSGLLLNLQVTDGAGNAIAFTGSPNDLFTTGITFVDGAGEGAINNLNDGSADGSNIIVVAYDLQLLTSASVGDTLTNEGVIAAFAAVEGGTDFTADGNTGPWQDMADVTLATPTIVKSLLGTSIENSNNSLDSAVIGETATYQVVITVPEGTAPNLSIVDTLDDGLSYVASSVTASTSNASDLTTDRSGGDFSDIGVTISPDGQTITFDLGTVTNANGDNTIAETITLTYTVIVDNELSNQQNTQLNNSAQGEWDIGGIAQQTNTDSAQNITVIEPNINTTKSVNAVGDAGDAVVYTIGIQHRGSSATDAYDLTFTDVVPTEVNPTSFTATHSSLGDISSLFELVGNTLQTQSGQDFDLLLGETVTITINGTVDSSTEVGTQISNRATAFWTSLPGADSNERDGSGGSLNNYRDNGNATFTIDGVGIDKSLVGTDIDQPGVNESDEAVIGEEATYQIVLTIPEGTIPALATIDVLDLGLSYIAGSVTATASSGDVTTDRPGGDFSDVGVSVLGQIITFDLGNVVNSNSDNNTTETITITYKVVVDNISPNVQGQTLDNSAFAQWNVDGNSTTSSSSSAADITVIEPQLTTSKSVTPIIDANDTLTYTIVLSNSDTSSPTHAYDVTFSDTVPSEISIDNFTVIHSALGDISSLFELSGNTLQTISGQDFDLLLNQSVTITINGTLAANVEAGQQITNTGTGFWTSLPGDVSGERTGSGGVNDYSDDDSATITIAGLSLTKDLISTSIEDTDNTRTEAAIGELARYRITITVPEGSIPSLQVIDTLDTGLSYVSASAQASASSGDVTTDRTGGDFSDIGVSFVNQVLTFDLGNVLNNNADNNTIETITIDYEIFVQNIGDNQRGDQLNNSALAQWEVGGSSQQSSSNSAEVITIIEPTLVTQKTVNAVDDAGDAVEYFIFIENSRAGSNADAYDVTFSDPIPSDVINLSFSVIHSSLGDISSLFEISGNTLQTQAGSSFDLLLDENVSITINGTVSGSINPGETVTNIAESQWTSLPGADVNERDGSESPSINDYNSAAAVSFTVGAQGLDKSLVSTSIIDSTNALNEVVIGELATYQVVLTIPEGIAPNVTVLDNLDLGLSFESLVSVVPNSNLVTTSLPGGFGSVNPITVGQVTTFFLGTITNTDTDNTVDETITITYTAKVDNIIENQSGDQLNNAAIAQVITGGTVVSSPVGNAENVTLLEPEFIIEKTADDTTYNPGEVVTYSIDITNDNNAANPTTAYDIAVTDLVPSEFVLNLNSIQVTNATLTANNSSGNSIDLILQQLAPGVTATITYTANIPIDANIIGSNPQNDVRAEWTSLPGDSDPGERTGVGGVNDYFVTDTVTVSVDGIDLQVAKDDGVNTVSPGDTLNYTINYQNNGNTTATGIVLTETLPNDTQFNAGASTPGWTETTPGSGIFTLAVADLGPGASASVIFAVTINDPVLAGVTQINNLVSITDDGSNGPDFDSSNNSDDDINNLANANPDYAIEKTNNVSIVEPGQTLIYDIDVSNNGNIGGTNVIVEEALPNDTIFDNQNSTPGWVQVSPGIFQLNIGTLEANNSTQVKFAVVVNQQIPSGVEVIDNVATVSDDGANGQDPNLNDNIATDSDQLEAFPDYALTKDDGNDFTFQTQTITYTITVQNIGNQGGTGIVVTDTYPTNVLTVTNASDGGVVDASAGIVTWMIESLAAGETKQLSLTATVNATAGSDGTTSYENFATVRDDGANGEELRLDNNDDSDTNRLDGGGRNHTQLNHENTTHRHFDTLDRDLYGKTIPPYFHGRLFEYSTITSTHENLVGARNEVNFDNQFGYWDNHYFYHSWSDDQPEYIKSSEYINERIHWGAYQVIDANQLSAGIWNDVDSSNTTQQQDIEPNKPFSEQVAQAVNQYSLHNTQLVQALDRHSNT